MDARETDADRRAPHAGRGWVVALVVAAVAGADACQPTQREPAAIPAAPIADAGPSGDAASTDAAVPTDAEGVAPADLFVRKPPTHEEAEGVDACAYIGGSGLACLVALQAEKDPVRRRYMRRLSDSDAHHTFKEGWTEPPHAEMAMECNDSGPCGKLTANGIPGDGGYSCLTKAERERESAETVRRGIEKVKNPAAGVKRALAASKKAHARACHCSPDGAQIPVMGGSLACDGRDKPVERGGDLSDEEADQIRLCATCDAERGAAACAREIKRLAASDPDLAKYIETIHLPRCRQP